jgi:glycosyltransferase involved in cell wall biosynthesis
MNKTWIITQLFYPDETSTGYVMTKIAETLSEHGEVNVICGSSNYQSKNLNTYKTLEGYIKIYRIQTPNLDKNKIVFRLYVFLFFTISVFFEILKKVKRGDTVVLVTNPPTLVFIVGILKFFFHFNFIIILQDIFPENAAASGIIKRKSITFKFISKLMNFSYKKADKLIACGSDMAQHFVYKGINSNKIIVIPNWGDHDIITPSASIDRNAYFNLDLRKKIVIEFAGNIGRVQGLENFIKIFGNSINENVVIIIIGDGAHKNALEQYVESNCLKNIYFLKSKPRNEQALFLNSCDIGLVTLCEGMFGLGVPSKVYNIMSAAKPILYIGDKNSEIDNYIKNNNIGWSFDWSEESEILKFINNLNDKKELVQLGSNALEFVLNNFTKEMVLSQYKKHLN